MSVNESRQKFEEAKKAAASCQTSIAELHCRSDTLQESLPGLSREVENAEKAKTAALDAFALSGNKESESELRRARAGYESAQKTYNESNELAEATHRALKKRESELPKLHTQVASLRHEMWDSIFEQKSAEIPASVRATVKELVTIGLQCSMGLNFILPKIFPLPTNSEIQEICKEQTEKHGITD